MRCFLKSIFYLNVLNKNYNKIKKQRFQIYFFKIFLFQFTKKIYSFKKGCRQRPRTMWFEEKAPRDQPAPEGILHSLQGRKKWKKQVREPDPNLLSEPERNEGKVEDPPKRSWNFKNGLLLQRKNDERKRRWV